MYLILGFKSAHKHNVVSTRLSAKSDHMAMHICTRAIGALEAAGTAAMVRRFVLMVQCNDDLDWLGGQRRRLRPPIYHAISPYDIDCKPIKRFSSCCTCEYSFCEPTFCTQGSDNDSCITEANVRVFL